MKAAALLVAMATATCLYSDTVGVQNLATTGGTGSSDSLEGYWYMTHSTFIRNDQYGCVTLYLTGNNNDGKIEGYVASNYLYVWWAPWYFNGDKIQTENLRLGVNPLNGALTNTPPY